MQMSSDSKRQSFKMQNAGGLQTACAACTNSIWGCQKPEKAIATYLKFGTQKSRHVQIYIRKWDTISSFPWWLSNPPGVGQGPPFLPWSVLCFRTERSPSGYVCHSCSKRMLVAWKMALALLKGNRSRSIRSPLPSLQGLMQSVPEELGNRWNRIINVTLSDYQ